MRVDVLRSLKTPNWRCRYSASTIGDAAGQFKRRIDASKKGNWLPVNLPQTGELGAPEHTYFIVHDGVSPVWGFLYTADSVVIENC